MSLGPEFSEYLAPQTDRAAFIQSWLEKHGVKSARTVIDGKNHILVQFEQSAYNPQYRIKTVIAHYDRVSGSPGANDNSAADWQIMNWAVQLASCTKEHDAVHNVRIFFTDGEELGWSTGVTEQGAYGIANVFKRLGITSDDIYVFDACGRGEVPVLSRHSFPPKTDKKFLEKFTDLYNRTQDLLSRASPGRWMTLPVPYSDNASFLACGIPAVAITLLPANEAALYARSLITDKNLEAAVMNREATKQQRASGELVEYSYKDRMPLTWRLFHTTQDNEQSLTPQSFTVMQAILTQLASTLTPA
jgi:hypothetical protein